jgi:hypothetical protein
VEVREELSGRITLRAAAGQLLPAVVVPAVLPVADLARGAPTVAGAGEPLLRLVYPRAPVVETRDLAIYEEVAHAASLA